MPETSGRGGCGRFLGDWTKGFSYVRSRGTRARGGLVLHHADDHRAGGGASGPSDQTVLGTSAGKGSPACRPYGQTHHPTGDQAKGGRAGAGRHAAEAGRPGTRRRHRRRHNRAGGIPQGRHGRAAGSRNRNRGNALMREVAEVVRKRPVYVQ